MFTQIFLVAALIATARAGLATSYAVGGIGLGGGLGHLGVGLRGIGLGLGEDRLGGGGVGIGLGAHRVVDIHTPAHYEFKYGVGDPKTGDRKEQSEARVGDVVRGEYSLAEPDGTIRVVKYTADDHNGFNAVVSRIGHAAHPQILLTHGALGVGRIGLGLAGHI